MNNITVLLVFNADGNIVSNNVFSLNDDAIQSVKDIASDSLLVIPKYMVNGKIPTSLAKFSGRSLMASNEASLAHVVAKLSEKNVGNVLVFGNDEMISELDAENCEYRLAVMTPELCNEQFPEEYVDGYESDGRSESIYPILFYKKSLKMMSVAKLEKSIDSLDDWINTDEIVENDGNTLTDDYDGKMDELVDKIVEDNEQHIDAVDNYDEFDDNNDDVQLEMIKMAADQVKQCIKTVNDIQSELKKNNGMYDAVQNAVVRIDQSIIHNNKVSIDTENYVNNRIEGFALDIDGLRQQVGIIAETLENQNRPRKSNIVLWIVVIVLTALNIINFVL